MYVLSVQFSCAVVSVFLFGRKDYLVLLALFYSTLLALTDRQTDRESNTLASHGLEEPFFQLCCCVVSVFGSGAKQVLVYILMQVLRVQYSCGVVLDFWLWQEIVFGVTYILRVQCTIVLLCQFFCCSRKQFVLVQLELKLIQIYYIQGRYI